MDAQVHNVPAGFEGGGPEREAQTVELRTTLIVQDIGSAPDPTESGLTAATGTNAAGTLVDATITLVAGVIGVAVE
jgi:hypothetical protein